MTQIERRISYVLAAESARRKSIPSNRLRPARSRSKIRAPRSAPYTPDSVDSAFKGPGQTRHRGLHAAGIPHGQPQRAALAR